MIPKRSQPKPTPPAPEAPALDPIEHKVIDLDFSFGREDTCTVTLTSADQLEERDDRFVIRFSANNEILELYKDHIRWCSRRERVFYTPAEAWSPTIN